jgi:hypothetical protein
LGKLYRPSFRELVSYTVLLADESRKWLLHHWSALIIRNKTLDFRSSFLGKAAGNADTDQQNNQVA